MMRTTSTTDQLEAISSEVLANAFLHDAPGDYRAGVLDALAAVRAAVSRAKQDDLRDRREARRVA